MAKSGRFKFISRRYLGLRTKGKADDEAEGQNKLMDQLRRSFALDSCADLNSGVELQAESSTAMALKPMGLLNLVAC